MNLSKKILQFENSVVSEIAIEDPEYKIRHIVSTLNVRKWEDTGSNVSRTSFLT